MIVPKFKDGDRIKHKRTKQQLIITKIHQDCYECDDRYILTFENQNNYELVLDKFDISTLKPFDKVLVWDGNTGKWNINFFSRFNDTLKLTKTMTGYYSQCIPYEGNEHLLDTGKDCNDYYKTWETEPE